MVTAPADVVLPTCLEVAHVNDEKKTVDNMQKVLEIKNNIEGLPVTLLLSFVVNPSC